MDLFFEQKNKTKLTQLTLSEVFEFKDVLTKKIKEINKDAKNPITVSGATGKFQMTSRTLIKAISDIGLDKNTTLFNIETQNKFGRWLFTEKRPNSKRIIAKIKSMNKSEIDDFLKQKVKINPVNEYIADLSLEFTSIPNPYSKKGNGSYYLNKQKKRTALNISEIKNNADDDKDFILKGDAVKLKKQTDLKNAVIEFFKCLAECNEKQKTPDVTDTPTAKIPAVSSTAAPAQTSPNRGGDVSSVRTTTTSQKSSNSVTNNDNIESVDDEIPTDKNLLSIQKKLELKIDNIKDEQKYFTTIYEITGDNNYEIKFIITQDNIKKVINVDDKINLQSNNRLLIKKTFSKNSTIIDFNLMFVLNNISYNEKDNNINTFFEKIKKFIIYQYETFFDLNRNDQDQLKNRTKEYFNSVYKKDDKSYFNQIQFKIIDQIEFLYNEIKKVDINSQSERIRIQKIQDIKDKDVFLNIENIIFDKFIKLNDIFNNLETSNYETSLNVRSQNLQRIIEYRKKYDGKERFINEKFIRLFFNIFYALKFYVFIRNDYYKNIEFDLNKEISNTKSSEDNENSLLFEIANYHNEINNEFHYLNSFIQYNGPPENIAEKNRIDRTQIYPFTLRIRDGYYYNKEEFKKFYETIKITLNEELYKKQLLYKTAEKLFNKIEIFDNIVSQKKLEIKEQSQIYTKINLNIKYFIDDSISKQIKYYKNHCYIIEENNEINLNLTFSIKNKNILNNILILSKTINDKCTFENLIKSSIKKIFIDDLINETDKEDFIKTKFNSFITGKINEGIEINNLNCFVNIENKTKEKIRIFNGFVSLGQKEIQDKYINDKDNNQYYISELKDAYEKLEKDKNITNITLRINPNGNETTIQNNEIFVDFFKQTQRNTPNRISVLLDSNKNIEFTRLGSEIKFNFNDKYFRDIHLKQNELSDTFKFFII